MYRYLFILLSLILSGWGCSGKNEPSLISAYKNIEGLKEINELNKKILLEASAPSSPADYVIGPADLLEVKVFEVEELNTEARVSSRGYITLPLLGNVKVSGLSARKAEEKIEELLGKEYVHDPNVTIFIKEHRSQIVSIMGTVQKPGNYEVLGRRNLLDALAMSEGLKDTAGRTVYVSREKDGGGKETLAIDLDELLLKGNTDLNIPIKSGDVVYVPEAGTVYVDGAVKKPGGLPLKEKISVSQAVAMAGGLTSFANPGDIKLVRYEGDGKRKLITLDLNKIKEGEIDDPIVEDRDIIVVPPSTAKRLIYGLRLNFLFGLFGVGYDPPRDYRY